MTDRSCPQCGTSNASGEALRYSHERWVLKQCGECAFVYLENPPEYEELETDFAWERVGKERQERVYRQSPVRTGASRTARMLRDRLVSRADPLVRRVERWFPAGPVVDIGCGKGDKLASLPERFELVGIEISQEQARVARERLAARGGVVHQMPALEGLGEIRAESLAGIVANAFLEHEIRPKELLQAAARALRPAGAMILKVPNYASVNRHIMGTGWCGFPLSGARELLHAPIAAADGGGGRHGGRRVPAVGSHSDERQHVDGRASVLCRVAAREGVQRNQRLSFWVTFGVNRPIRADCSLLVSMQTPMEKWDAPT